MYVSAYYIFKDQKNEIDGIIPKTFRSIKSYCFKENQTEKNISEFVQYRQRSNSQKEFMELFTNLNIPFGTGNVSIINAMWGPITNLKLNTTVLTIRGMKRHTFHRSTAIAVIVTRKRISLYNKFIRGFISCKHTFILPVSLIVVYGILTWILERKDNDNFNESFLRGAMTGIWWSFITLTTVGYGDVVPKSLLGRILACVVMYTRMVIVCVITGTVTALVSGTSDLGIYKRRVAVVKDSYEERIAKEDYKEKTVSVVSYKEVIKKVRNREVFAGLMNKEDVFAYQDSITADDVLIPLRIIYTVPAVLDLSILIARNDDSKLLWKCVRSKIEEVYLPHAMEYQTKLKIETFYYDSISALLDDISFKVLLGFAISLGIIGILSEFKRHKLSKTTDHN
ncbi:uncharacterized protein LOC130623497 [Hydractinia symbiolongicarpus]|uniref:uncharacterized protein LOC130623497 n=1 Tax=Hydractinia symbiolongicarpus TaxID=13093 RepID=UPI002551384D|nr:uncharacterized protein LOC130623497 [Hydractinia symbiolongicarpus]